MGLRKLSFASMLLIYCGQVFADCSIATTPVTFGIYDPLSTMPTVARGEVLVTCTQNNIINVTIILGPSAMTGLYLPRSMKRSGGSDLLSYNLYTLPSYNNVWGDGTGGTVTQPGRVKNKSPWNATVYGSIPAGQDVAEGSYNDILVATIIF